MSELERASVAAKENDTGETEEETSDDGEDNNFDQELRGLYGEAEEMISRYATQEERIAKKTEITPADIGELYRILASDILPLVRDVIAASGAAVTDVANLAIDLSPDDDDEDGGDDDTIDEDTLLIYSTLLANGRAYEQLLSSPGIDPKAKEGFQNLLALTQSSLKVFDDQFGENIQKALQERMKAHEDAQTSSD